MEDGFVVTNRHENLSKGLVVYSCVVHPFESASRTGLISISGILTEKKSSVVKARGNKEGVSFSISACKKGDTSLSSIVNSNSIYLGGVAFILRKRRNTINLGFS